MPVPILHSPVIPRVDADVIRGFRVYARIVGWATLIVAGVGLLGWLLQWPAMASLWIGGQPIRAMTALAFLFAGLALLVAGRDPTATHRACLASALVLGALAIAALADRIGWVNLGLDGWILTGPGGRVSAAVPPIVGAGLLLLALRALAFCGLANSWFGDTLSITLLALAMIALAALGATAMQDSTHIFSPATPLAAILLFNNTMAWIALQPTTPLSRVSVTPGAGGVFARRLLMPSLLLPLLYTWLLRWMRERFGIDEISALSIGALFTGCSVAVLVWHAARLTERMERQHEIIHDISTAAFTDALTGLPNRRAFDRNLERLLHGQREQDRGFCLLMLDLDRFKGYNDNFGHLAGDEVLRGVGKLLRRGVRPGDLAARYGGEEFAVLLPDTGEEAALHAAERIRFAFDTTRWPHRQVTVSIGVAPAQARDDAQSLIARADAALYAAKQGGRNRVVSAQSLPDLATTGI